MTVAEIAVTAGSLSFAGAMIWAAVTDLNTRKIHNKLIVILLAVYLALAPLAGFSLLYVGWSATVALGVLIVMFLFFSRGWVGGGDAKLISVISLWVGSDYTTHFLIYTAVFGGVLTMIILPLQSQTLPSELSNKAWLKSLRIPGAGVPYGVAIAAGALAILPCTPWLTAQL